MRSATKKPAEASAQLFADACAVIPGGVNSPVRAFTAVGGTPALHHLRRGLLADRRRRQPLRRPGVLVGADDPGSRPPRRRRGRAAGRGGRTVLRRPYARRDRAGRRDHRPGRRRRAAAAGQFGHRGHHERDPAGPRLHRPRQDHQVRRLLPRPQRCASRRRRLRRRDARPAILARCHRRRRRRHDRVAVQQHLCGRGRVRAVRRRDRLRDQRGQPRQHGHRRAAAGLQRASCAASPPSTARC